MLPELAYICFVYWAVATVHTILPIDVAVCGADRNRGGLGALLHHTFGGKVNVDLELWEGFPCNSSYFTKFAFCMRRPVATVSHIMACGGQDEPYVPILFTVPIVFMLLSALRGAGLRGVSRHAAQTFLKLGIAVGCRATILLQTLLYPEKESLYFKRYSKVEFFIIGWTAYIVEIPVWNEALVSGGTLAIILLLTCMFPGEFLPDVSPWYVALQAIAATVLGIVHASYRDRLRLQADAARAAARGPIALPAAPPGDELDLLKQQSRAKQLAAEGASSSGTTTTEAPAAAAACGVAGCATALPGSPCGKAPGGLTESLSNIRSINARVARRYTSAARPCRFSIKIDFAHLHDLPHNLMAVVNDQMLAGTGWQAVSATAREGCVELVLDLRPVVVARVVAPGTAARFAAAAAANAAAVSARTAAAARDDSVGMPDQDDGTAAAHLTAVAAATVAAMDAAAAAASAGGGDGSGMGAEELEEGALRALGYQVVSYLQRMGVIRPDQEPSLVLQLGEGAVRMSWDAARQTWVSSNVTEEVEAAAPVLDSVLPRTAAWPGHGVPLRLRAVVAGPTLAELMSGHGLVVRSLQRPLRYTVVGVTSAAGGPMPGEPATRGPRDGAPASPALRIPDTEELLPVARPQHGHSNSAGAAVASTSYSRVSSTTASSTASWERVYDLAMDSASEGEHTGAEAEEMHTAYEAAHLQPGLRDRMVVELLVHEVPASGLLRLEARTHNGLLSAPLAVVVDRDPDVAAGLAALVERMAADSANAVLMDYGAWLDSAAQVLAAKGDPAAGLGQHPAQEPQQRQEQRSGASTAAGRGRGSAQRSASGAPGSSAAGASAEEVAAQLGACEGADVDLGAELHADGGPASAGDAPGRVARMCPGMLLASVASSHDEDDDALEPLPYLHPQPGAGPATLSAAHPAPAAPMRAIAADLLVACCQHGGYADDDPAAAAAATTAASAAAQSEAVAVLVDRLVAMVLLCDPAHPADAFRALLAAVPAPPTHACALHLAVAAGSAPVLDVLLTWHQRLGLLHEAWDARALCGITPLHVAAGLDDGGRMAAHILARYPSALAPWHEQRADDGVTPAAIARSQRHWRVVLWAGQRWVHALRAALAPPPAAARALELLWRFRDPLEERRFQAAASRQRGSTLALYAGVNVLLPLVSLAKALLLRSSSGLAAVLAYHVPHAVLLLAWPRLALDSGGGGASSSGGGAAQEARGGEGSTPPSSASRPAAARGGASGPVRRRAHSAAGASAASTSTSTAAAAGAAAAPAAPRRAALVSALAASAAAAAPALRLQGGGGLRRAFVLMHLVRGLVKVLVGLGVRPFRLPHGAALLLACGGDIVVEAVLRPMVEQVGLPCRLLLSLLDAPAMWLLYRGVRAQHPGLFPHPLERAVLYQVVLLAVTMAVSAGSRARFLRQERSRVEWMSALAAAAPAAEAAVRGAAGGGAASAKRGAGGAAIPVYTGYFAVQASGSGAAAGTSGSGAATARSDHGGSSSASRSCKAHAR